MKTLLGIIATCLLFTGCAAQSTVTRSGQRNLLTADELARAGDVSLYDALRVLRPTFLQARSASTTGTQQAEIQVYIGPLQMEGVGQLREIMAKNVREVRYLEPREANARFGSNHGGGALLVTMQE